MRCLKGTRRDRAGLEAHYFYMWIKEKVAAARIIGCMPCIYMSFVMLLQVHSFGFGDHLKSLTHGVNNINR